MSLPQAVGLSEGHFFFSLISHTVGMRTLGEVHRKVLEVRYLLMTSHSLPLLKNIIKRTVITEQAELSEECQRQPR